MAGHGECDAAGEGWISGEIVDGGHRLMARVYFADTDYSGVVYHARYLEFLERGRSDFLRLTGVHHTELEAGAYGEKLVWVVRRMEIDFRSPAKIDDLLTVDTRVAEVSGARIRMVQRIRRGETVLIDAQVEAALLNGEGKPRRFPKDWIGRFAAAGNAA
jgi:acyl-CoA thioester hydrolase